MRLFQIEQSKTELYTSHSGLALVGLAINRYTSLEETLKGIPKRHGIANVDLIRAYVGQLSLGKNDFDALENVRKDPYFRISLGIGQMPSPSRLRQRFDEDANKLIPLIDDACVDFVKNVGAPISPIFSGHIPLDVDAYPMDNSGTKKEGVSRTYKGYDGYTPIGAYLGVEGWVVGMELREGSWHGQKEFDYALERIIPRASELVGSEEKILFRADAGYDAQGNREFLIEKEKIDFLIRWNPRRQKPEQWLEDARERADEKGWETQWSEPREGKSVVLFSELVEEQYTSGPHKGEKYTVRRVIRITERTTDKKGQLLLLPEVTLEGWWTTLDENSHSNQDIIDIYKDRGTSEQFHSEFKTDLDLERLPSGKFDTNDLVLILGALTYNILRYIGLTGLMGKLAPVRHPAKRRRIRTVMQELMYLAGRVLETGRQLKLRFSRHCPAIHAFEVVYQRLAYG